MNNFVDSALFKFGNAAGWLYLLLFAAEGIWIFSKLYYAGAWHVLEPLIYSCFINFILFNLGLAAGIVLLIKYLSSMHTAQPDKNKIQSIIKIINSGFSIYILSIIAAAALDISLILCLVLK